MPDRRIPERRPRGVLMLSVCIVMLVLAGKGGKGDGCWAGGFLKSGS